MGYADERRASTSHEELQYLELIKDILERGEHRPDRYLSESFVTYPTHSHSLQKDRHRYYFTICASPTPVFLVSSII